MQHNFEAKLFNFGGKIPHFLGKLQKFSPLRARNFEKVHCMGIIFQGNSLHCNGFDQALPLDTIDNFFQSMTNR